MKMLTVIMALVFTMAAFATDKKEFRVCWSHYTGWEPWAYADNSGILKKHADKHGIKITLTRVNDYAESLNLYTGGTFAACTMTSMDALTVPALAGIDSQAVIVGDYSNGNDAVVAKGAKTLKDLKGRDVMLVELTVSHYLLARALETVGMKESDLRVVNTSDADIASAYKSRPKTATVTWNPMVMDIAKDKDSTVLFDSSKVPGEIIDLMVVRNDPKNEALKLALTGAWYETMQIMNSKTKAGEDSIKFMAKEAGGSVADFIGQLKTTAMFYTPQEAVAFTKSPDLQKTMDYVRTFSHAKGIYSGKSKDAVGIEFDNGAVLGNKANIKLRFTSKYMEMAAQGKL